MNRGLELAELMLLPLSLLSLWEFYQFSFGPLKACNMNPEDDEGATKLIIEKVGQNIH